MARTSEALQRRLASLAELPDVSGLLADLGFEPAWEPIPAAAFFSPDEDGGGALLAVVARRGEFLWYGLAAPDDGPWAGRLIRRLVRRGEVGGAAVLSSDRQLALGVAFGEHPVVALSLESPDPGLLGQLARLATVREHGRLAIAARVADILGAEAIGRRFFRRFAEVFDEFTRQLEETAPPAAARELALMQLTRVLFLYFVQARGWLDGRSDFLAREVDRCLSRRGSLQRHLLGPLFFGTLNRPAASRSAAARTFGRVPFLNGGLFEPHPLERRHRVMLPTALWRDAFDRLFERFRFTAAEAAADDAIAPDMLGRVFEGLMERSARKTSGTFYTPAALVREVVAETFAAWIAGRSGCTRDVARRLISERDPRLDVLWADVTVLDPAVGSGAFLLGALELLAAGPGAKRAILERHLFGVDKDATAVRLAELRLWLAVLADDGDERPEAVRPLPNLDCLVRQGDSLFDPWWRIGGLQVTPVATGEALAELRRRVVLAAGPAKSDAVRSLRRAEIAAAREILARSEARLDREIGDCLSEARSVDLFGRRRGADAELRRRLRELRSRRREVRRERRALERQGLVPWFHYHCHFGDVFARRGGFDLVVGNPPWVRAEELPAEDRTRLRERYRWWRGAGHRGVPGYGHQPDLALAFLERAVELTAPGGAFGLLVPRKVTAAGYAAAARESLATTTSLEVVADLTESPLATFEATTYPLALIGRKARPTPEQDVALALGVAGGDRMLQSSMGAGGPWILSRRGLREALGEVDRLPALAETVRCHLGVKTGANDVYLDQSADVEESLRRWAVRGRDISPWHARPRRRVIWTHGADGGPLERLPPRAAAYFERHRARLVARTDYRGGQPWQVFRTGPASTRHLVAWPDLAARLAAVPLCGPPERRPIPLNTCYLAVFRRRDAALALAAWLNSNPLDTIARARADVARGGYIRCNASLVGGLPLPRGVMTDGELVSIAGEALAGGDVRERLDARVSDHLGLSAAARRELTRGA